MNGNGAAITFRWVSGGLIAVLLGVMGIAVPMLINAIINLNTSVNNLTISNVQLKDQMADVQTSFIDVRTSLNGFSDRLDKLTIRLNEQSAQQADMLNHVNDLEDKEGVIQDWVSAQVHARRATREAQQGEKRTH